MMAPEQMSAKRAAAKSRFLFLALAVALVIGSAASAQFADSGFEQDTNGAPPNSPWQVTMYLNPEGITLQAPQTEEGLNLFDAGIDLTVITNSSLGIDSQIDPNVGTNASLRWPRYGDQCALINDYGKNENANSLSQSATVGTGMINPIDGQIHITFVFAPVLQNPHHLAYQQPYYFIQLQDDTQDTILYEDFGELQDPDIPWKSVDTNGTEYDYTDWQLMDVAPGGTNIMMGDQLTLTAIASGCSLGGHMGQLYMDGIGGPTNLIPGIFMTGAAPPAAVAGGNLTYMLTYRNGCSNSEDGVVLSFNTPQNTTFQSVDAPGLVVSPPEVGTAGLVSCALTNLGSGESGNFAVTVNVDPGTSNAIVCRDYYIYSNEETPLIGPKLSTAIVNLSPIQLSGPALSTNGSFCFCFTNVPGVDFTVLCATNVSLPFNQWTPMGGVVENPAGFYTFSDEASKHESFYAVSAQ
jgi:hypothetical protein